ncbi:hypothetical protein [Rhodoferax ferrireducens]|uniref:hypothetical protein n=1 Tax=Rhodoferax ferrireducens TaxID=192843 RepID=UPI000E0D5876|nr:hypothetical protein [Rhodoferax ferrireducens]
MSAKHASIANSQDWAAMGLPSECGQNAFTGCPARGRDAAIDALKKPGPKPDGKLSAAEAHEAHNASARAWYARKRNAELEAQALAFKPGANSHNYASAPTASKPATTASARFATA